MNLSLGFDLAPGYTETMRFLNSEPGQRIAMGIEDIIQDLVRLFHSHASKSSDAPANASQAQPTPAKS